LEFGVGGISADVAEFFLKVGLAADQAVVAFLAPDMHAGDIRGFVDAVRGGGFDGLEDFGEGVEDGFAVGGFALDLGLEKEVHMVGHDAGGEEEEAEVREATYEAIRRLMARSELSAAAVDWFFFQNRTRCPETTEPDCPACPVQAICARETKLFQPVWRTTAY
jgi:hypothetical protein